MFKQETDIIFFQQKTKTTESIVLQKTVAEVSSARGQEFINYMCWMKHKAFYQQMLTCVLEASCNETAGATNLTCEQNSLQLTFYMQSLFSKHAASRLDLMQCRPAFNFHALNSFWLKQFQIQGYLSNFHWFKHAQEHVHIYIIQEHI